MINITDFNHVWKTCFDGVIDFTTVQ